MTREARRELFRKMPMFASLSDADLDAFLPCLRWRSLHEGEVLFRQGEPGDSMYIVLQGHLSVRIPGADGGADNHEMSQVGPGELLGEMACIDPAARSATVVAADSVQVGELGRDALSAMRSGAPRIFAAIVGTVIRDVTRRVREVDEQIERELGGPAVSAPLSSTAKRELERGAAAASGRSASAATRSSVPPPAEDKPEKGAFWRFLDRLRGKT